MRSYDHEFPLSSRLIKKGDAFPIAGSIACSKKDLHPPFVRESFLILMRREIARALGLIVVGLMISLAACQSGGTASSRAEITDPNTAFSQGGAHTNSENIASIDLRPARHLETLGLEVRHIHKDGQLESPAEAIRRLVFKPRIQGLYATRSS